MPFELKDGVNFPPEKKELDKILLQFGRDVEKGDYHDSDLLSFLKTGEGLYSFEDESRGMDDANFVGMSEMRLGVIKKYIQTTAFLWQYIHTSEIELHVEHNFEDIEGIDIQKEIEAGRNQELAELSKVTKQVVFDLVDAKSLLENTEVLEFDTDEEIFFFVLNLLGLGELAAYLNGEGRKKIIAPGITESKLQNLVSIIYELERNGIKGIVRLLGENNIDVSKYPASTGNVASICEGSGIQREDLEKITIKKASD